ncbi:ABC transporter ATP-binding protein [Isoptericola variabilis]|uniref:Iron-chelate-transporting ATPase n=1 Tax=Isoptericola variabilis (strain 225) TaxID=743718 RepID=F6FRT1_ISOV2|nr:ATP-binding cassette domain-containing protein [Isoptericola variabilis]AEG43932.1 Iron-chelate-transporting ATPase [Isoptericola variabilis 225]TWH30524.1 iron complex transport system ATP-binding protein [Isoptericola variabilis J7]
MTVSTTTRPGLAAERVRWAAGSRLILDGVDVAAPAGAVTGLLGPNGSGKSTLLRIVAGVQPPDGGRVALVGPGSSDDLLAMPRRRRARTLALVEQDAGTDLPITVLDAVLLGRTPHRGVLAGPSDADRRVALAALDRAGALPLAERDVGTLSGGERQRVHVARALAQEPRVLLLDEPINHLDVAAQLATMRLVRSLADDGVTVLAALHDLSLAAATCDHVVLLAPGPTGGRVAAAGPVDEVLVPEVVDPVYGVRTTVLRHPSTGRPVLTFDDATP